VQAEGKPAAGAAFKEGHVDAGGFRIRYMEAGQGPPLIHLHGAGGLRLTPGHDLLSRQFHVIALEMPGFGQSSENTRTQNMPERAEAPSGSPEEMARRLYAHPERLPPIPPPDPAVQAKTRKLVARLRGPDRDADLERQLAGLATPTLVLVGTVDRVIPSDMGHIYKELMPNCHLVFVYDAGHAISTDRPEAFTEVVVDFLERHEAFVISRTPTVIHP